MMLRKTSSWVVRYTFRRRVRSVVRKAFGFSIFGSGFTVIVVYLLQLMSNG
jgi:hypothetical protein